MTSNDLLRLFQTTGPVQRRHSTLLRGACTMGNTGLVSVGRTHHDECLLLHQHLVVTVKVVDQAEALFTGGLGLC